jgi:hypothetical protein
MNSYAWVDALGTTLLIDFILNPLAKPMRATAREFYSMLDGKRYYAVFPDENPVNKKSVVRYSPALIAALRALEKELRPFIPAGKIKELKPRI